MSAEPPRAFVGRIFRMNNVRDAEGRPLGERRVPEALRGDAPMETKSCPYAGKRRGLPMNVSALRQMHEHWPVVLAMLRGLRRDGSWRDLYAACVAGVSLPALIMARSPAALPAAVAALYKVLAGTLGLVRAAVADGAPAAPPETLELLELAESSGRLVADHEACAGPAAMIAEALDALLAAPRGAVERPPDGLFTIADAATDQMLLADVLTARDRLAEREVLATYVGAEGSADPKLLELARGQLQSLDSGRPLAPEAGRAARLLELVQACSSAERSAIAGEVASPIPPTLAPFLERSAVPAGRLGAVLAAPLWRYVVPRRMHAACVARLEQAIGSVLGAAPAVVSDDDRDLFPRLHAQAWLEALAGARLEIGPGGARLACTLGTLELHMDGSRAV